MRSKELSPEPRDRKGRSGEDYVKYLCAEDSQEYRFLHYSEKEDNCSLSWPSEQYERSAEGLASRDQESCVQMEENSRRSPSRQLSTNLSCMAENSFSIKHT